MNVATTQGSAVINGWTTSPSHIDISISESQQETSKAKFSQKEPYDDPRKNYGFLIATSLGDSQQENWFHPSHSILQILKDENYDLARLPTQREKAIHIEHDGIPFRFHKIPNPVIDLHKIEPHKALANKIFNTIIRTLNKLPVEGSYEFDLLQPVILNFSKISNEDGTNPEFKISYPGILGKTMHEIKSNFGNENIYAYSDAGESLFLGWLENSANKIAKSLFA